MTFADDGYEVLPGLLNDKALTMVRDAVLHDWETERQHINQQSLPEIRALHKLAMPHFSSIVGKPLQRHSATFRVYQPGDILNGHIDADPITVSVSIALYQDYPEGYGGWPLWMHGAGDIYLEPGDGVIFSGQLHGRLPFDVETGLHIQATLFYKDSDTNLSDISSHI